MNNPHICLFFLGFFKPTVCFYRLFFYSLCLAWFLLLGIKVMEQMSIFYSGGLQRPYEKTQGFITPDHVCG